MKALALLLMALTLVARSAQADLLTLPTDWTSVNSLVNPSFETGDLSGWTVSGTSPSYGVARVNTVIDGTDPAFGTTWVVAQSGVEAVWALVACGIPDTLILSQAIYAEQQSTALVGFTLANGGSAAWGTNVGYSGACGAGGVCDPLGGIAMLVNGQAITPAAIYGPTLYPGDALLVFGQADLNPGWNDLSFQITASGTYLAGVSADDFFAHVPEPSTAILLILGLGALLVKRFGTLI